MNTPKTPQQKPKIHFGPNTEKMLKLFEKEIATYVREGPRLLLEGEVNRHALIKGDEIVSIWDTRSDARQAGWEELGEAPACVLKISERDINGYSQVIEQLKTTRDGMTTEMNPPGTNERKSKVHFGPGAEEAMKLYEKEIATYLRELPNLVDVGDAGRYALIKGDVIVSIWDTDGDAIQAGRSKYGLEPIFVKKIDERDIQRFALLNLGKEEKCP